MSDARERIRDAWGDLEQCYLDGGNSARWVECAAELWRKIDIALGVKPSPRRKKRPERASSLIVHGRPPIVQEALTPPPSTGRSPE